MTALILGRHGKKYRKEEKSTDLTVKIYSLCKGSIDDAVQYGKNGIWNINTINKMADKLNSEITNIVNISKSESYKEGFWNGQQAKIEKVEMTQQEKNTFAWPPLDIKPDSKNILTTIHKHHNSEP